MPNFTTGPTNLPDVGALSYNGCVFSPLFETKVSSNCVKDAANRTVKFMEYTIMVDGYVTGPDVGVPVGDNTKKVVPTMANLYKLLTAQGGSLIYRGRAHDIIANGGGAAQGLQGAKGPAPVVVNMSRGDDVAWGPVPEMLEFQPLGGGNSAKIQWKVAVRLLPPAVAATEGSLGLLQLNYETVNSYGEDGFSSLSIKGTMEVPMTRRPAQVNRDVRYTVDSFRGLIEERILAGIDIGRFKVTRRDFTITRDKRTLEFNVQAEEKPYMDNPPDCTMARGSYTVRPAKAGPGLALWLCTLRATYTVRANRPRSTAWRWFMLLLRLRMQQSLAAPIPDIANVNKFEFDIRKPSTFIQGLRNVTAHVVQHGFNFKNAIAAVKGTNAISKRVMLIDFSVDEGLYQDSKTVSFSASWRLACYFKDILIGSGVWKKLPEGKAPDRAPGNNLWALSMRDVQGSVSCLPNTLDPALDIIVDFGSTEI